jgi:ribosomal protein L6P/L9E
MTLNNFIIKLPVYFNTIILKKNYSNSFYIIIYDETYFYKIFKNIYKNEIKIDKELNTIEVINKYILNKNNNINLNNFLKGLNYYFFKKIKFKGKGYKIRFYEDGKLINFHFGSSHKTIIQYKNIKLIILGKYKFILLNSNKFLLNKTVRKTLNIKKINIYTLRGLRLAKQVVLKRTGKKGSYV